MFSRFTGPLIVVSGVAALGFAASQYDLLSLFTPPCEKPIEYTIGTFDTRFNVSRVQFKDALQDAASVWNEAAGKTLFVYAEDADLPVNLEYSTEQQTSELGEVIDTQQAAYDAAKEEFQNLADSLERAKTTYDSLTASFEKKADAYERDVAYWNARGGAPQSEYQKLQARQRELKSEQERLNTQAATVNSLVEEMNSRVDNLNALAEKINARVDVYNANAHTDFDQGRYIEDKDGKRITIREFTEMTELKRVLAHELGHALGLDHVENPDSIMYSYNVGSKLTLTPEDTTELADVCNLE